MSPEQVVSKHKVAVGRNWLGHVHSHTNGKTSQAGGTRPEQAGAGLWKLLGGEKDDTLWKGVTDVLLKSGRCSPMFSRMP